MRRMQATISLKQLRTDPRRYIDLLNRGYEVTLTDHGRTAAIAEGRQAQLFPRGTVGAVLEAIRNLPPLEHSVIDKDLDYKTMLAKARLEDYEKQHAGKNAQTETKKS